MDYIKVPATLVAGSTILIPERFCPILIYGMSTENEIIQLSDKAKSYILSYLMPEGLFAIVPKI